MAAGQPFDQTGTHGAEERVVPMHQSAEEQLGTGEVDAPGRPPHVYRLAHEGPEHDPESGQPMAATPDDAQARGDEEPVGDRYIDGETAGGEIPGDSVADDDRYSPPNAWLAPSPEGGDDPEPQESDSGEYRAPGWGVASEPAADPGLPDDRMIEPIHRPPPPVDIAAARSEFAAAELRASAALSEGFIESEAIRVRGKQEARMIIQRAEERAAQVLERTNTEAQATERRARLSAEAILAEAQVRLDSFLQDHVSEEEEPVEQTPPESAPAPAVWESDAWPAASQESSAWPMASEEPSAAVASDVDRSEYRAEPEPEPGTHSIEAPFPGDAYAREMPAAAEPTQPPAAPAPVSQSTSQELPIPLFLAPLPPDGDKACYRISGPLTFAQVMALERTLAGIEGVRSASVTPEAGEGARIAFISDDPAGALGQLITASGLPIQIAAS
jgi:hypothetical protein